MRVQPSSSAVSPSVVQRRRGHVWTVDAGMTLHPGETHKIVKSCSPAQQPGNHRGKQKTFRTSAGLMVWRRVCGRRLALARLPAELGSLPLALGAVDGLIAPML